jgi:hypothetical protein
MKNTNDPTQQAVAAQTQSFNIKQGTVSAVLPQGHESRINIRFVPGTDITLDTRRRVCQPRQGAERRDADPIPLSKGIIDTFKANNRRVIEWMAQSAANATLFLHNPVEALQKAGVKLSRAEQKELSRTFSEASAVNMISPGVKINSFTASTTKNPPPRTDNNPGKDPKDKDCGCK